MAPNKFIRDFTRQFTRGSKLSRAQAGIGFSSMALSVIGLSLMATGVGAPIGVAMLGVSSVLGVAGSSIQLGQGIDQYMHGNRTEGKQNMIWGSVGIGLSAIDFRAGVAAKTATTAEGVATKTAMNATTTAKVLGGTAFVGGMAIGSVGLAQSIQSGNELGITQATIGLGLGFVGAGAGMYASRRSNVDPYGINEQITTANKAMQDQVNTTQQFQQGVRNEKFINELSTQLNQNYGPDDDNYMSYSERVEQITADRRNFALRNKDAIFNQPIEIQTLFDTYVKDSNKQGFNKTEIFQQLQARGVDQNTTWSFLKNIRMSNNRTDDNPMFKFHDNDTTFGDMPTTPTVGIAHRQYQIFENYNNAISWHNEYDFLRRR